MTAGLKPEQRVVLIAMKDELTASFSFDDDVAYACMQSKSYVIH